jgi:2-hydroxy-6-oxonona-2,4-dienedioate hydrolase
MNNITQESSSRTVQVTEGPLKDFTIHFNDFGSGETVVMLHGSGPGASGWSNFHRNVEPFVQAGFRVLLVDSPGWSHSDPIVVEKGPRAIHNAAAVKGVLDALGVHQAHLVGNSMGGTSALQFALDFPDRVGKLIVMGGGGVGPSLFVPMPLEGIKLIGALYRDPTVDNLKRMMDVFVYDTSALTDDLIKGRLANMLEREDHLRNFVLSAEANPRHLNVDLTARLAEIKVRTMVTWGRDDRFMPMDSGLRLLWSLPNAELHVFSKCGHWAQWEHADRFNQLVVDFLKH